MGLRTGATLTSFTTITMVCVAAKGGTPLSVTLTAKVLVAGPCASVGLQEKTPVVEIMLAPAGALSRLKVREFAGMSASLAVAVKVKRAFSLFVRLDSGLSVGARFTSFTTIVTTWVALRGGTPLSVTITRTALVFGPWASLGVQVKTPLPASMFAPAGALESRLNVSPCAGRSESVA